MNAPFPAEPMAAFFAAVTAVETGQVGEVELMFTYETESTSTERGYLVSMAIEVRKTPRPRVFTPMMMQQEEKKDE